MPFAIIHQTQNTTEKMKPKPNPMQHIKGVSYTWCSNGVTCHGRTIVNSSTRAGLRGAERRFWKQNPHIQPEEAS